MTPSSNACPACDGHGCTHVNGYKLDTCQVCEGTGHKKPHCPACGTAMETPTRTAPPVVLDRLVRLLLRWICRKLVKQGSLHKERIVAYYRIMREAAESEFTEDNKPTLDAFLGECHSEANDEMRDRHLKQPPPEEGNTQ